MIFKNNNSDVLLSSGMGFEFEFYSNHSVEKTATLLSRVLGKKISIEEKAHSDFKPTTDHYKLEPDMSGGQSLLELVTGNIPYQDARIEFIKILKWIQENGNTGERAGMHINISFDDKIHGQTFLSHMNVLKFILDFDEEFVYDLFPERKASVYAKSVKFIVPKDKYYFDDIRNINPYNFIYPNEKYYGINFEKLVSNYLEFRYLGGEKYEYRINDLLRLIDHFVLELYRAAKNPEFTESNYTELKKILNNYQHLTKAYISFSEFKKYYPEVGFLVDMDSDDRRIDLYWGKIRDQLFSLLNECNLKDGIINYNSDTGRLQLKNADLRKSFKIEGIDIIDSKIRGVVTKCDLFGCEIEDAEVYESNLFNGCKAFNCKIMDCYTNQTSILTDCYVDGGNGIMNGSMRGGIHRKGRITNISRFDKNVEKIEFEKIRTNNYVKQ
jgi:hypothetical protein